MSSELTDHFTFKSNYPLNTIRTLLFFLKALSNTVQRNIIINQLDVQSFFMLSLPYLLISLIPVFSYTTLWYFLVNEKSWRNLNTSFFLKKTDTHYFFPYP